eukprot:6491700-Amphidinium_carterae.2
MADHWAGWALKEHPHSTQADQHISNSYKQSSSSPLAQARLQRSWQSRTLGLHRRHHRTRGWEPPPWFYQPFQAGVPKPGWAGGLKPLQYGWPSTCLDFQRLRLALPNGWGGLDTSSRAAKP